MGVWVSDDDESHVFSLLSFSEALTTPYCCRDADVSGSKNVFMMALLLLLQPRGIGGQQRRTGAGGLATEVPGPLLLPAAKYGIKEGAPRAPGASQDLLRASHPTGPFARLATAR